MAKVNLITYTPEPEKIVAAAAKLCYSNSDVDKLMDGLTEDKVNSFLEHLTNLGHQSPLEHVSFTFSIEGVSRSFLAQITRHRVGCAYSVRSQRYCSMANTDCVIPEQDYMAENGVDWLFTESYKKSFESYNSLVEHLTKIYVDSGIAESVAKKKAQENARYVLPEACNTAMIVTMNARELHHFFELRCCNRAQTEIREVAEQMLALVKTIAPHLFANAGPSCVSGGCGEGSMSCGKAKEVREKYSKIY